ncbi:MAG: universal stress protein [Bacteroidia bacterium]
MKNILVLTDFSENATNAAFYALNLFKNDSHKFTLINAFDKPHPQKDLLISVHDILFKEAEKKLKDEQKKLSAVFEKPFIEIHPRSEEISSEESLAYLLRKAKILLVVIGIKSNEKPLSPIYSMLMQQAWSPLLLVPDHAHFSEPKEIFVVASDTKIKGFEIKRGLHKICTPKNNINQLIFHKEDTENYWIDLLKKMRDLHQITKIIFVISQGDVLDQAIRQHQIDKLFSLMPILIIRL